MHLAELKIQNFRGISHAHLLFTPRAVLIGDNNTGKSTILEAIDLVLGPERLSKTPAIDEHDFYAGRYLDAEGKPVAIEVEATVIGLTQEQENHFRDHIEWWRPDRRELISEPPPDAIEAAGVVSALRVMFRGAYDPEEDDFVAHTYFCSPTREDGALASFWPRDKRVCGFLFLRTLRTGSRALSLERGSLLDVIMRLKEVRLKMWEQVLGQLRQIQVANDPALGLPGILTSIQDAVRNFVPSDWADQPHLRVSDLTRENLRRVLTVFLSTGATMQDGTPHAAPYQHQGTGTINTLVLAMLSLIAEEKQNVIFAMEEPEIAIPPHTQKRIVDSIRGKSAQALFTSHSPYVLEEFDPSEILVLQRSASGELTSAAATFPPTIKPKAYRQEFRSRFSEALLARKVLLAEGRTEADAIPAAARRLAELDGQLFQPLEALGMAVFDAGGDSQIAPFGAHFRSLGKRVFAVFDAQADGQRAAIIASTDHPFESTESGFEMLVLNGTAEPALRRFAQNLVQDGMWPNHLVAQTPQATTPIDDLRSALRAYLSWAKGAASCAELLATCQTPDEFPAFVRDTIASITELCRPPVQTANQEPTAVPSDTPEPSGEQAGTT